MPVPQDAGFRVEATIARSLRIWLRVKMMGRNSDTVAWGAQLRPGTNAPGSRRYR